MRHFIEMHCVLKTQNTLPKKSVQLKHCGFDQLKQAKLVALIGPFRFWKVSRYADIFQA